MSSLPEILPIEPLAKPVQATIRVPGSKSYTNRALPIAALAQGRSRLFGVLDSEDTQVMVQSLRDLGIPIELDSPARVAVIEGCGGRIPSTAAKLFCKNSGTSIRFLTALVCLGHGTFTLDGNERMRQRPIGDLLEALRAMGVAVRSAVEDGYPPVVVEANGLGGGKVSVRADVSSQFLSGLLIVAPLAGGPLEIGVTGPLVSEPYVRMTLATMRAFGVSGQRSAVSGQEGRRGESSPTFEFSGRSGYVGCDYQIEPDASAASYFFGAAAISGGRVTVSGLGSLSLQGDLGFVHQLERMGCQIEQTGESTTVIGRPLKGIDTDLCHLSDTVPTLAVVACFANSATRIRGVAHARVKETDRLAALATELRKVGARVQEHPDGLTIEPAPMHGAVLDTYDDHRMAMSLALLGLRTEGISVRDPGCTVKTYPDFFADLAKLSEG